MKDIRNIDTFELLKSLKDGSVDMILTDPPYFAVTDDDWDNQWNSEIEFLEWLDELCIEFKRVLKKHGSFYLFCDTKRSNNVQNVIQKHFNVLQNLRWVKNNGYFQRTSKPKLRNYFHQTESIIFAEHPVSEYEIDLLRRQVFKPLIDYMIDEMKASGLNRKDIESIICEATNKQKTNMFSHYFSDSQFTIPTKIVYELLQLKTGKFSKSYDELKKLNAQLSTILRPFKIEDGRQYTDVLFHDVVPSSKKNRHFCEKPLSLLDELILTSSRDGDVILDCFAGSGAIAESALKNNRSIIASELDEIWYNSIIERIKDYE